ncbi:MAG: hypothetical protein KDA17_08245 [Candidatus Saccharibacteria bacterium]|nr:hypothetical protein [Candidatus Saccharibacteria bacterium]
MNTQVIMQDPEIHRQIGELTGRFNTFEVNMAREFAELKQTIREQSVVPYAVYEKRVTDIDTDIANLRTDVELIKDKLQIRDYSVTGKVAAFLDSAVVKIIGTGIVAAVLFAIYINYQQQIDSISEKVDNATKVQNIEQNIDRTE